MFVRVPFVRDLCFVKVPFPTAVYILVWGEMKCYYIYLYTGKCLWRFGAFVFALITALASPVDVVERIYMTILILCALVLRWPASPCAEHLNFT